MTGLLFWSVSLSIKEGSCLSTIVFKQIWSGWLLSPVSPDTTFFVVFSFYLLRSRSISFMCAYARAGWSSWMKGRDGGPYLSTPQILHRSLRLPDFPPVKPANMPGFISTVLNKVCAWRFQSSCSWSFFVCVLFLLCATVRTRIHIIFADLERAGYVRTF